MDWNLFWSAFGAVGTTLGSLVTAIAVVVAVIQYRQPITKKVKVTTSTAFPIYDVGLGDSYFQITVANIGIRSVIISNIYLNAGKQNLVINNLLVDIKENDKKIYFPKTLEPECILEVFIPYKNFALAFIDLVNQNKISQSQTLKVLATDTTNGKYFSKSKFKVKQIISFIKQEEPINDK